MQVNYSSNKTFNSFWTDRKSLEKQIDASHPKEKQNKKAVAAAAFAGALFPVVALNLFKGRGKICKDVFQNSSSTLKDKFKAGYNLFEIENFREILASTTGGVLFGTLGGLFSDKNPKNHTAKQKEGIFEFLNCMTPTCFAAIGETYSKKTGKMRSPLARGLMIASSVAGGMFVANKTSNKINEKVFGDNEDKRGFKISDCFVHIDDILSLLVIAKIPFAKIIQADKILPFLYARSGYEAGTAQKDENKN